MHQEELSEYHVSVLGGMHTAHYFAVSSLQRGSICTVSDQEACAKEHTRACQCSYLMLSVGNVHVTVRNYEYGVRGVVFRHVQRAEACFFKLGEPAAVALHLCCLSKAAGVRRSQHSIGMECSFLVQGPVSRGAQRSFETTDTLHLFYSHHLSSFIFCSLAAYTQSLKLMLVCPLHFCIRIKRTLREKILND